ncbi:MAG: DNA/RNA nuclease SfsA [bacterium]|nr:DNA/RNA nuclease SfsA [bacterium]
MKDNKQVFEIKPDARGYFVKRKNRFAVNVKIPGNNGLDYVHLHDPGRLKELLFSDNEILLKKADNPERKTKWDIIAARSKGDWILINSSYHRYISENLLRNKILSPIKDIFKIDPEKRYKDSRLDYLLTVEGDKKVWVEVKGCTLLDNGLALFPDAPTVRGAKHLEHLIEIKNNSIRSALIILVLVNAKEFKPNVKTDKKFTDMLRLANDTGVEIYPVKFSYDGNSVKYENIIPFSID